MLTLSLSTALSPLAKAEEARHTWKTLTSVPGTNDLKEIYISSDGSKLFVAGSNATHNTNLWMSADDGATWRKIFSKQTARENVSISANGSKIVLKYGYSFSISTDGGQSWSERGLSPAFAGALISPDGSFLVGCSGHTASGYIIYISTDDGQTWTQKGVNQTQCPTYVTNNGTIITTDGFQRIAKSTDYGQTWTETPGVLSDGRKTAFSNNGNYIFDVDRISLDGGNHWTPSNAPIPAGYTIIQTGISDDGKKLFVSTAPTGYSPKLMTLLTSIDGGKTWSSEDVSEDGLLIEVSSDGSKVFYVYDDNNGRSVYRVGTLPAAQPVTPGSGAGGTATPSASTSATPGQKPGKASGRLAETGTSTWMVGGLAAIAVAAGALVLRKRL
ncbi:MAG: hypothetical protein HXL08_03090 [Candidatus Nanosynbacter sp.]|nr:hypothetical protein [Candidatus Nanosynbacter sp.]